MNAISLVESGKYTKKDLTQRQRDYIEGMETALETIKDREYDFLDTKGTSTLEKIQNEIACNVIGLIADYVYSDICESIVCFADGNCTNEANSKIEIDEDENTGLDEE